MPMQVVCPSCGAEIRIRKSTPGNVGVVRAARGFSPPPSQKSLLSKRPLLPSQRGSPMRVLPHRSNRLHRQTERMTVRAMHLRTHRRKRQRPSGCGEAAARRGDQCQGGDRGRRPHAEDDDPQADPRGLRRRDRAGPADDPLPALDR